MHKSKKTAVLLATAFLLNGNVYASEAESITVDAYEVESTELASETILETVEDSEVDSDLKNCIVISSDSNIGTNAYFPEVSVIAWYGLYKFRNF